MTSLKYLPGDYIGPNKIYLQERVDGKRGVFKCPFCGKLFTSYFSNVSKGVTKSCGCATGYLVKQAHRKDISGNKYGHLTAIKGLEEYCSGHRYWLCRCDCGKEVKCTINNLTTGNSKTCGDTSNCQYALEAAGSRALNLKGQRFGKLVAASPQGSKNKKRYWLCQCDCGNTIVLPAVALTSWGTSSCGCIKSKGEEKVALLLNSLGIDYERQKCFDSCRSPETNHVYWFDFYLPEKNLIIEYDGFQHFKATGGWNNEESLERNRLVDAKKNDWCKQNHVFLLRISYKEYSELNENYLLSRMQEVLNRTF